MYSVILCGGSGTRLWPLSRKNYPKQFLKLYSEHSLIQETFLRMRKIMEARHIFFVTNQDGYFNVLNQIREVEKEFSEGQIIIEPKSLNTAPAIALAMKYLAEKKGIADDQPVIFLPADHFIGNQGAYLKLVQKAFAGIGEHIGTIGITPTKAETGFGYIRKGARISSEELFEVREFKEKPDKTTAEKYVKSKEYVWNSGMYLFSSRVFTRELKEHAPEIFRVFDQAWEKFLQDFLSLPSISIDYAISEKSQNVIVFEGEFGWSDIGSFDSIAESFQKDVNKRHVNIDSKNVYVHTESNRLVATLGIENVNIIETADSILVQKQGRGDDVKKVVEYLKEKDFQEVDNNLIVHRPWGKYEVLMEHPLHKVKKITVYPQAKLSLQSHVHRAEHWVVVHGVAEAVIGEKTVTLKENESTYIPKNTKHRLGNPGETNLEIIEVQTGDYLGEDDITRYDDLYKRA